MTKRPPYNERIMQVSDEADEHALFAQDTAMESGDEDTGRAYSKAWNEFVVNETYKIAKEYQVHPQLVYDHIHSADVYADADSAEVADTA